MKLFKKKNEEPKEDLKITLPYMSTDWAWPFLVPVVWRHVKNLSRIRRENQPLGSLS